MAKLIQILGWTASLPLPPWNHHVQWDHCFQCLALHSELIQKPSERAWSHEDYWRLRKHEIHLTTRTHTVVAMVRCKEVPCWKEEWSKGVAVETENPVFAFSISQPVSVICQLHLWENWGGMNLNASPFVKEIDVFHWLKLIQISFKGSICKFVPHWELDAAFC